MLSVLLIDDDLALSRMLTEYLAGEGFETTTAEDGEAGVRLALAGGFDVVILDVMMPRLDGLETLRRIRRVSDVPVVMLTARGDNLDRVTGLEMGADDYVPKPYYPLELVARLRAVLRRRPGAVRTPEAERLTAGRLELLPLQRRVSWDGQPFGLTASEFNVLEVLLRAGDEVVPKDDLSIRALGRRREPYDRSVDVHISNIRLKLVALQAQGVEIETVRGIGYRINAT